MGVNFKQLKQLNYQLENVKNNILPNTIENIVNKIAEEFLKEVIKRTPKSNNNFLKENWKKKITKNGSNYIIEIYNNVEYASLIEYGHKVDNGYKQGYYMMTITNNHILNNINSIGKSFLDEIFRGVFK